MLEVGWRRHLQVPLVSAERAWATAMELKSQLEAGADAPKRRRLLRRLAKVPIDPTSAPHANDLRRTHISHTFLQLFWSVQKCVFTRSRTQRPQSSRCFEMSRIC